jgi:preprotein translocase subunit SecY
LLRKIASFGILITALLIINFWCFLPRRTYEHYHHISLYCFHLRDFSNFHFIKLLFKPKKIVIHWSIKGDVSYQLFQLFLFHIFLSFKSSLYNIFFSFFIFIFSYSWMYIKNFPLPNATQIRIRRTPTKKSIKNLHHFQQDMLTILCFPKKKLNYYWYRKINFQLVV